MQSWYAQNVLWSNEQEMNYNEVEFHHIQIV